MPSTTSPLYIAFYTIHTPYEKEIKKLKDSLERFALPYDIEGIFSLGSWQENTKYKATFIQNMLFKHAERPLVYVDADAIIQKEPVLFNTLSCDIAAHYYDNGACLEPELLSGTLYINATENGKKLIGLWRYLNYEFPNRWEQKNLAIALKFMPEIHVFNLPPTYCQIFDLMKDQGEPVIEHFQASRQFKDK